MEEEDRLMTIQEVSKRLRVSTRTIRRWIADDRLKGQRVGSTLLRVRASEVKALLDEGVSELEQARVSDELYPPTPQDEDYETMVFRALVRIETKLDDLLRKD